MLRLYCQSVVVKNIMRRKKKINEDFLSELISLSGKPAPEVYKKLGFYYQTWSYQVKVKGRAFPAFMLPHLVRELGITPTQALRVIEKFYPNPPSII